jgi:hypothetical protein
VVVNGTRAVDFPCPRPIQFPAVDFPRIFHRAVDFPRIPHRVVDFPRIPLRSVDFGAVPQRFGIRRPRRG